jgi:hypothetical protein
VNVLLFTFVSYFSYLSHLKSQLIVRICIFSPLSALHNSQHLSHRPFFKAFMLQPLVVTVISLLPNSHVIDWPPLSRKSAAGNLQTQIRPLWPCSSRINENLKVNTKVAHTFNISHSCWCSELKIHLHSCQSTMQQVLHRSVTSSSALYFIRYSPY